MDARVKTYDDKMQKALDFLLSDDSYGIFDAIQNTSIHSTFKKYGFAYIGYC